MKVFVVVVACIHLVNCAATIAIRQNTSSGEYPEDTLLVDFSMISESCANETIDLISKSYDLLFSSNSCAVTNDTDYICEIFFGVENYRNGCNASGGEFYSGLYLRDPALTRCTSNISGTTIKRELTMNYPFCAGTSCNGSEIVMAYTAMISADRESGHLNEVWTNGCSYPYIVTSNAYNSHIAVGIIYVTLAMFSIVMLLSL